jgi:hypothetical protein
VPVKAIMRSLRTRDGCCLVREGSGTVSVHLHVQTLTLQLHASSPMNAPTPVTPKERRRADDERMQENTHLARFGSRAAIPLTLLAQRTGTTTVDAGRIHDTQTPIGFFASLMGDK